MRINWVRCESYQEAQNYCRIVYLHEWDGKPFYWGKAHNSFFGGGRRERDGLTASGRYNSGYRHWIEGCLRHGGRLYIGQLDGEALARLDEVECYLIHKYGSVMNSRMATPARDLVLEHVGDVPQSIGNSQPQIPPLGLGVLGRDDKSEGKE